MHHRALLPIDRRFDTSEGLGFVRTIDDPIGRWQHVDPFDVVGRARAIRLHYLDGAILEPHGPGHQRIGEIHREVHQEQEAHAAASHTVMVALPSYSRESGMAGASGERRFPKVMSILDPSASVVARSGPSDRRGFHRTLAE